MKKMKASVKKKKVPTVVNDKCKKGTNCDKQIKG